MPDFGIVIITCIFSCYLQKGTTSHVHRKSGKSLNKLAFCGNAKNTVTIGCTLIRKGVRKVVFFFARAGQDVGHPNW